MDRAVGVADAAANNAAWCDLVCRTHGIVGVAAAGAWTVPARAPQWYPDAVTVRPDTSAPELLARIDAGPGASVKDSFARLELGAHGFDVLFDATWIGRVPGTGVLTGATHAFSTVDASGFGAWTTAWSGEEDGADILGPHCSTTRA